MKWRIQLASDIALLAAFVYCCFYKPTAAIIVGFCGVLYFLPALISICLERKRNKRKNSN
jgi:hypothetical protein